MIDKETVKKLVGLCKLIDKLEGDKRNLYKVVDKLEKRISTLEKKLEPKPKQLSFDFNQDQPLLVEQPCLK
tara:strand:- start:178 stop:390 length:213 start_codon:yes stop_codon:yes gene_type:complete